MTMTLIDKKPYLVEITSETLLPCPRLEARCALDIDLGSWTWVYRLIYQDFDQQVMGIDLYALTTTLDPVKDNRLVIEEWLRQQISNDTQEFGLPAFAIYGARHEILFYYGVPVENCIEQQLVCGKCKEENQQPNITVGSTAYGWQVWCNNHNCNLAHIDFQGRQHPIDFRAKIME
jgi:hypothetical protein